MPWRYAGPGRLRLAAAKPGSKSRSGGRRGLDVDDHIRHAVREESAATLGRAGAVLQEAVAALAYFDRSCGGSSFGPDIDRRLDCNDDSSRDTRPRSDDGFDEMPEACLAGRATRAPERHALLIAAAAALWQYVVQREAMGLTGHDAVDKVYGVTPELWRLMGSAEVVRFKSGQ